MILVLLARGDDRSALDTVESLERQGQETLLVSRAELQSDLGMRWEFPLGPGRT